LYVISDVVNGFISDSVSSSGN